jgi:hypothetical protein
MSVSNAFISECSIGYKTHLIFIIFQEHNCDPQCLLKFELLKFKQSAVFMTWP